MRQSILIFLTCILTTVEGVIAQTTFDPDQGLIAHFKLNNSFDDVSGHSNSLVAVGSPSFKADRFGNEKASIFIEEFNERLSSQNFDNQVITTSLWFEATEFLQNNQNYIAVLIDSKADHHPLFIDNRDLKIGFWSYGAQLTDFELQLGNWYQFILVTSQNSWKLFVNGVLVSERFDYFGNSAGPITGFGNFKDALGQGARGSLDDIRIYNRALSDAEVAALYELESTPPAFNPNNGLVAYYPFNGNANDESGNGKNGSNGGATTLADRHGNENAAFWFDGENDAITVEQPVVNNGADGYTFSVWAQTEDPNRTNQTVLNSIPHDGFGLSFYGDAHGGMVYWKNSDPAIPDLYP